MEIYKTQWNKSYSRQENYIFYPKEDIVKFLSRFVRKRVGINTFEDIAGLGKGNALDVGCGIGRQTLLLNEFGFESFGIDISDIAIQTARDLCEHLGQPGMQNNFSVSEGDRIPFDDSFFSVLVCDSVLDSMEFSLAKKVMLEIDRVTSGNSRVYISLIADNDSNREEVVASSHEHGTVQSYFNLTKLNQLIKGTEFKIQDIYLKTFSNKINDVHMERYHVTLLK